MLIGKEELLLDLFDACVSVEVLGEQGNVLKVKLTNNSSLPFSLKWEGNREVALWGHSAAVVNVKRGTEAVDMRITNMLYAKAKSPVAHIKLK